jgi:hypothetical protein
MSFPFPSLSILLRNSLHGVVFRSNPLFFISSFADSCRVWGGLTGWIRGAGSKLGCQSQAEMRKEGDIEEGVMHCVCHEMQRIFWHGKKFNLIYDSIKAC